MPGGLAPPAFRPPAEQARVFSSTQQDGEFSHPAEPGRLKNVIDVIDVTPSEGPRAWWGGRHAGLHDVFTALPSPLVFS